MTFRVDKGYPIRKAYMLLQCNYNKWENFPQGAGRMNAWQKDSIQIDCLCYNAAHMQYHLRFANDNNNDNDDPRIVGRSLAG